MFHNISMGQRHLIRNGINIHIHIHIHITFTWYQYQTYPIRHSGPKTHFYSKIVTNAVRPRPSPEGECPVTSGQDTSAREDSAPRANQDSSNGTPTNSLFKK